MIVYYETFYGNVVFDLSKPNIIVCLSGGFDSAVVLYGLAHAIANNHTKNVIHPVTIRKTRNPAKGPHTAKPNPYPIVDNIINWMRTQFPTVDIEDTVCHDVTNWWIGDHGKNYAKATGAAIKKLAKDLGYDSVIVFNGVTKNPPLTLGNEFFQENGVTVHRNPTTAREINSAGAIGSTLSVKIEHNGTYSEIMPFRNHDKRAAFSFADRYGDVNKFLEYTRSCEASSEETANFTVTCNTCWQCCEREWALLNYKK